MKDLCVQDDNADCTDLLNKYLFFCFDSQDSFEERSEDDLESFTDWWSGEIAAHFEVDKADVLAIYQEGDELETILSVDTLFWYGDSLGFEHVPALLINGVLQEGFPETEAEWMEVINQSIIY